MESEIRLENISKSFQGETVLNNFSLSIARGKTLSILGPSGCGKTTLLRIICGLTEVDAGIVSGIDEKNTSYVFQEDRLLPWKNVYNNIRLVLQNSMDPSASDVLIRKILEILELTGYESYYPYQLSGGMRQRVAFARAFCYPSELILMDEPFKGLDLPLKNQLIQKVRTKLFNDPRTIILVTHDPEEAVFFGDRIILLSDKPAKIIEEYFRDGEDHSHTTQDELISRIRVKLKGRGL